MKINKKLLCFLISSFLFVFGCEQKSIWDKSNAPIDDEKPFLDSVVSLSNTSLQVNFNEQVDEGTSEDIANYSIPGLVILSAVRNDTDYSIVLLTTQSQLNNQYELTVTGILDEYLNEVDETQNNVQFTGDALPAVLSAVSINNTTVRVTFSEEIEITSAEDAGNYYISDENTGLTVIDVFSADLIPPNIVDLTTSSQPDSQNYTLDVIGIEDLTANSIDNWDSITMPDPTKKTALFSGDALPTILSSIAVNNAIVRVNFSENVDQTSAEDVNNYSIYDTSTSSINLNINSVNFLNNRAVELITDSQDYINYTLTINGILDSTGNLINPANNQDIFIGDALPAVSSVDRSASDEVVINFTENIETISASDPGNYTITGDITLDVMSVSVSGSTATLYLNNGFNQTDTDYHVNVANVEDLAGNIIDPVNDTTFAGDALPRVINAVWYPDENVDLVFSEPVDPTVAQLVSNYSVTPGLSVSTATSTGNIVHLLIQNQADQNYTIIVNYIEDMTGNPIHSSYATGTFTGNTSPYAISVINNGTMMIDVKYSEEMVNDTSIIGVINISNYTVTDLTSSTTCTITFISFALIDNTAHLTMLNNLISGHEYEIILNSNIEDISGNNLIVPYTLSFIYP